MDARDRQSYPQQTKNHVHMHAHMYDIHVTHMYAVPACMYVAALWNEVKGARWLCGISPRMVSPQHLRYLGHDEGRPSGHSPPLTC